MTKKWTTKKRITIKSIAQDLGISHMTVSRALSTGSKVNEKTRKTIRKRAAELGYIPNQAALAMRGSSSRILGLLVPNIKNEFYASFANQMSICCEKENLQLMIGLTQDDPDVELSAITRLRKHQVHSVVIVPTPGENPDISMLFQNIQVLQLIRTRPDISQSSYLTINEQPSFAQAAQRLIDGGCKRIAFIGGYRKLSTGRNRLEAVTEVLKNNHIPILPELILTDAPSYELGMNSMRKLIRLDNPPDGVIAAGFEISNGAIETCLAEKIDIPNQLRFIGFGNPSWYQWAFGGISTIRLPIKRMAETCVTYFANIQKENTSAPDLLQVNLEAQLILRNSG